MKRKLRILALAGCAALALHAVMGSGAAQVANPQVISSRISSFPLAEGSPLTFVGGLKLTSEDGRFGGISGLRLSDNGSRIDMVTDEANWMTAEVQRNTGGAATGISNLRIKCLCKTDGTPYGGKHWGDSEALEISGSTAYVGFERLNRINAYDLGENRLPGKPRTISPPFKPLRIAYNEGLESIALAPKASPVAGKFVAIAEHSPNASGDHRAFIVDQKNIREFSIKASDEFWITDATFLENGDLVILERRFGWSIGLDMRIRRFDGSKIAPGATLDGEVLMQASLTDGIDNMEGISAWTNGRGQTVLSVISDDNFKSFQRTILLEFVLNEKGQS